MRSLVWSDIRVIHPECRGWSLPPWTLRVVALRPRPGAVVVWIWLVRVFLADPTLLATTEEGRVTLDAGHSDLRLSQTRNHSMSWRIIDSTSHSITAEYSPSIM